MPLYEYECTCCGFSTELSRSVADRNNPVVCEECVKADCSAPPDTMVLIPSLSAISLKGDGWTPKGSATPAPPRRAKRGGYDMTGDRDLP